MSDKLNLLTSNIIRFVAGERPTADKFNAMNLYYTRAVDNICRAIGDMHDRSINSPLSPPWNPHEDELEGRPLDIVNLARLIGPASNLNPKMFGTERKNISEVFEKEFIDNSREVSVKYPISGESPLLRIDDSNGDLVENLNADSYTLINDRTFILNNEVSLEDGETLHVTYSTVGGANTYGGINYLGAGFNTIPDPNETDSALTIIELPSANSYSYEIDISNLEIKAQQSGSHNLGTSSIESLEDEYNQGLKYSFPNWWQEKFLLDDTTPKELTTGLVYLKNIETGEIYLTAEYAANSLSKLYIRGANLCLTDEHRLILAGTDITTSIDDLRNKMFNHRHDGSFGEPFIRIQDLIGKYVTGEFGPSSIPGNEFPMYLHRKGYQVDDTARNGNNAMLGDIFMAVPNFIGSNSLTGELVSNKLVFGTSGAFIHRILGMLLIKNEDSGDPNDVINTGRGNIALQAINKIILTAQNNEIISSEDTKLDQTNLISDSTNNTEINSDNETHLQINSSNVIVLKKNDAATDTTGAYINGFESFTVDTATRVWEQNDRSVLSRSEDLVKKNYTIVDFEPSTKGSLVAPCGILTQSEEGVDEQSDENFLFLTSFASVYIDGNKRTDACLQHYDSKGRTFHQLEANYENFILNYKKKITKPKAELEASDYGVWNQQFELDGDPNDIASYRGEPYLGGDAVNNVDFCFGGINYANKKSKENEAYTATTASASCYSHRFEPETEELFQFNKNSYSIITLESDGWSLNPAQTIDGKSYSSVNIPLIENFTLIGNDELRTRHQSYIINDFQESLLQEINYTWGIKVTYQDKVSWLVGKPNNTDHEMVFGVHYDYEWRWQGARNYEFDLKLTINPRRLFKATAQEVIDDKDNYTFEAVWRPYNYTRPSLKPTDLNITTRRITTADPDDGGWGHTSFSYTLLSADYEEEAYPEYVRNTDGDEHASTFECVDQRVPTGADINFLIHDQDLHNRDYKKLCPISLGVLTQDYYPGTKGAELATFEIHDDPEESKYCRAASVGGSKQSIAIIRNLNFEEGISSKNFIINTNGGNKNKIDSSFLFEEYFIVIRHNDVYASGSSSYLTYRRGINTLEKPNFLLNYSFSDNDLTTFSLNFNGKDGMLDLEIEDCYLKNKIINLSNLISRRFAIDIWKEHYAIKTTAAEDSFYRSDMINSWYKYYGRDSEIKARLNTQKNWINLQRSRNQVSLELVNGMQRVNATSTALDDGGSVSAHTGTYHMPYIIQALFVGAWDADDSLRMPFTLYGAPTRNWNSYVRDVFFDVAMDVKETFNSYTNHLNIDVKCNYIIKKQSVKSSRPETTPSLWSKKGVLEFPSWVPITGL